MLAPLRLRLHHDQGKLGRIREFIAVQPKREYGKRAATVELALDQGLHSRSDLVRLVEKGASITHHLIKARLAANLASVSLHPTLELAPRFEYGRICGH